MNERSGSHVKLEGRHELSERQQEVLGLMAEGRTNYEIAEALDLSLEGAKYHVSEILGKLGVDSREEAIVWWRSHRPIAERLPQRMRFLWPALGWVGGVAAVGVAGLVVLGAVLHFVGSSSGPTDGGPAEVWVAVASLGTADSPGALTIMQPGTSAAVKVLATGNFYGVAWSPDGQTLAVFPYLPTNGPSLLLYSRATWAAKTITLPATPSEPPQWSPDGEHLAIVSDSVLFLSPDGKETAETGPLAPDASIEGGVGGVSVGQFGWSSDTKLFATALNGGVQVTRLDGTVITLDPTGSGAPANPKTLSPAGWRSANTFEVFDRSNLLYGFYAVTLRGSSQTWTALNLSGTPIPFPTPGGSDAGSGGSVIAFQEYPRTADGRGTVRELGATLPPPLSPPGSLAPAGDRLPVTLTIEYEGATTDLQLPKLLTSPKPGWNYDVVITGGR